MLSLPAYSIEPETIHMDRTPNRRSLRDRNLRAEIMSYDATVAAVDQVSRLAYAPFTVGPNVIHPRNN